MANHSSTQSSKNFSLDDDMGSHPVIEWLAAHKSSLLYGFIGLIVAMLVASRFINWQTLNAEKDYSTAETLFNQFQESENTSQESSIDVADFQKLEALMQRHPELKPKYEGSLAQTFIIHGQIPQAETLAKDIFQRTQRDHLQLYQDYTQASLVISEGKYTEGLQQAQQLEEKIHRLGGNTHPILNLFNLIRLATLYQITHQFEEELIYWNQLQNQFDSEEAQKLDQVLKVGQASLSQYIAERIHALTREKSE